MVPEKKIMSRGRYYLTPFQYEHVQELLPILSVESIKESYVLGYNNPKQMLDEAFEHSEAYIVREEGGPIICLAGLFHDIDAQYPQMYAMFTKDVRKKHTVLARGSKMLVSFFDQQTEGMSMSIMEKHGDMCQWAAWLGFEPVGLQEYNNFSFVDFVRCNPNFSLVYKDSSRPMTH